MGKKWKKRADFWEQEAAYWQAEYMKASVEAANLRLTLMRSFRDEATRKVDDWGEVPDDPGAVDWGRPPAADI